MLSFITVGQFWKQPIRPYLNLVGHDRDLLRELHRDLLRELHRDLLRELHRDLLRELHRDLLRKLHRDLLREIVFTLADRSR